MSVAVATRRGTTNRNDRGSAEDRRRRREWLVTTYRANRDLHPAVEQGLIERVIKPLRSWMQNGVPAGQGVPACRCYRCGDLLTANTVTVDRIIPGCMGGTYRRNNIRPACGKCNSETGGALARRR